MATKRQITIEELRERIINCANNEQKESIKTLLNSFERSIVLRAQHAALKQFADEHKAE